MEAFKEEETKRSFKLSFKLVFTLPFRLYSLLFHFLPSLTVLRRFIMMFIYTVRPFGSGGKGKVGKKLCCWEMMRASSL